MAKIKVNDQIFDVDLIAFDKDGTLIDLHHLWGQKAGLWVDAVVQKLEGREMVDVARLRTSLCHTLGYDPETVQLVPDGPVAVASAQKILGVAAAVLYQQGVNWYEADTLVFETGVAIFNSAPATEFLKPIGDVAGTFKRLTDAGVRIAITTSDDREPTKGTLPLLGIADDVEMLVCGNDPFPNKPHPAGLNHVSEKTGVSTSRMLMVGDSESDIQFGRNSGTAGCIGIFGGGGDEATLSRVADQAVGSIDEFIVVG